MKKILGALMLTLCSIASTHAISFVRVAAPDGDGGNSSIITCTPSYCTPSSGNILVGGTYSNALIGVSIVYITYEYTTGSAYTFSFNMSTMDASDALFPGGWMHLMTSPNGDRAMVRKTGRNSLEYIVWRE